MKKKKTAKRKSTARTAKRTGRKTRTYRRSRKKKVWTPKLLWLIPISMLVLAAVLTFQALNEIQVTTDVEYTITNARRENDYDMSALTFKNGIASYDDGVYTSRLGVDLSYYNYTVDFSALKKAGVSFVMIRCGYRGYQNGKLQEDERFKEYMDGAQKAGLDIGVYFFSQAVTEDEAAEEARFVIELIRDYDITMPVAYDYEYVSEDPNARGNAISIRQRTDNAVIFAENMKNAGYTPLIYASTETYDSLYDYSYLTQYQTWIAQYADTCTYPYAYTIWQYTDEGVRGTALEGMDLDIQFLPDYGTTPSPSASAEVSASSSASAESTAEASPSASASSASNGK